MTSTNVAVDEEAGELEKEAASATAAAAEMQREAQMAEEVAHRAENAWRHAEAIRAPEASALRSAYHLDFERAETKRRVAENAADVVRRAQAIAAAERERWFRKVEADTSGPQPGVAVSPRPRAAARAESALERLANVVPQRINTEEIGDALEQVHRLAKDGQPSWLIYLTVARACVAVLRHTLRHGAEQLRGIVMKITAGPGGDQQ